MNARGRGGPNHSLHRVRCAYGNSWVQLVITLNNPTGFTQEIELYSRNVRIKLRPNAAPEFSRILEEKIIPLLRKQVGFQDEIFFVSPKRNEAMAISFWDEQVNAEAYNHVAYLDVLKLLSKVVDGMPVVETFEVANATFRESAANAA